MCQSSVVASLGILCVLYIKLKHRMYVLLLELWYYALVKSPTQLCRSSKDCCTKNTLFSGAYIDL